MAGMKVIKLENKIKIKEISWIVVGLALAAFLVLIGATISQVHSQEGQVLSKQTATEWPPTIQASYKITKAPINISSSLNIDRETKEIGNGKLIIGLVEGGDYEIPIAISLLANPDNEPYEIRNVYLRGKENKEIEVDEKIIIVGTSAIINFYVPASFGNTFELEGLIVYNATTINVIYHYFTVDILRESNGNIYYFKESKNIPKEPGFEGALAVAAVIVLVVTKRKKRG